MSINSSTFTGRITADPEVKCTNGGKSVCTFNVAIDKGYGDQKKTFFPTFVAWEGKADFVGRLRKGTKISIRAEYNERTYEDKQGNKRKAVEFVVQEIEAMDQMKREEREDPHYQYETGEGEFDDLPNDDGPPF